MEISLDRALHFPKDTAIDLETTGLNWKTERPLILGLSDGKESGYVNLQKYSRNTLGSFFKDFLASHRIILQNAKFDFHFIKENYSPVDEQVEFSDTMLLSQIIDENISHKLDDLTLVWLGPERSIKKHFVDDYKKKNKIRDWSEIPTNILAERCEEDALNTYLLYDILRPKLTETSVYALEKKVLMSLLRIEHNGALIDKEYLMALKKDIEFNIASITKKYSHLNLRSSQQIGNYLFKELGITPVSFTDKGHAQTTADVLHLLNHPAANDFAEVKTLGHTLSTFVEGLLEKLDEENRLHCNFKQMGARTGRMSCVNPNLQQMPKKGRLGKWIKSAFIGNITAFDYSQMEAVLYAFLNKEQSMIKAINNGEDLYCCLANILYKKTESTRKERDICKELFLGTIYGLGKAKFSRMSSGLDRAACDIFFGRLRKMQQIISKEIRDTGYVETIIGRKRHLSLRDDYKGINALIQGSAADIIKTAMVNMPISLQDKILSQIHDELVFYDLNEREIKDVAEIMCDFPPFNLRVEYGSGKNWWEAFWAKENKGR